MAAPPAIAADGTVRGRAANGDTFVLRRGHNGSTCLMTAIDPVRLPVSYGATLMAWRKAIMAGDVRDPDKPGVACMLRHGSAWSNTDPGADKWPPGHASCIRIPPHVTIPDARTANASGTPSGQANPDAPKPFVMFGGMKYAILITPVR